MPFYYYRNSKCLGRAVSGAGKDLNLALIGYCGYFHFSFWQLELLAVLYITLLWVIYGSPRVFSRHLKSLELSDLGFELLMQISWLHIQCAASYIICIKFVRASKLVTSQFLSLLHPKKSLTNIQRQRTKVKLGRNHFNLDFTLT